MGDTVHRVLEDMVPELEDLKGRGLFSEQEIKSIVRKRTHFEFLLVRRVAKKVDFMRYIEYELNLDKLRRKRRRRLGVPPSAVSDHSCQRRVQFIYQRALRKFGDDLSLWNQFIQHALKGNSSKTLSQAFPRALQLHPRVASLWVQSASYEYQLNNNVKAARVIFQRGLRFNDDSLDLWHAFFRMELMYALKLFERKSILGLVDPSSFKPLAAAAAFTSIEDVVADDEESDEEEEDKADDAERQKKDAAVMTGAIASAIFSNAMKQPSLCRSLEARRLFIQTVMPGAHTYTDSSGTSRSVDLFVALRLTMYRDLVAASTSTMQGEYCNVWGFLARTALEDSELTPAKLGVSLTADRTVKTPDVHSSIGRGLAMYECALALSHSTDKKEAVQKNSGEASEETESLQRSSVYCAYVRDLSNWLDEVKQSASEDKRAEATWSFLSSHRLAVCARAADENATDDELMCLWVDGLVTAGEREQAMIVLDRATQGKHGSSVALWRRTFEQCVRRICCDVSAKKLVGEQDKHIGLVDSVFQRAARTVSTQDRADIWLLYAAVIDSVQQLVQADIGARVKHIGQLYRQALVDTLSTHALDANQRALAAERIRQEFLDWSIRTALHNGRHALSCVSETVDWLVANTLGVPLSLSLHCKIFSAERAAHAASSGQGSAKQLGHRSRSALERCVSHPDATDETWSLYVRAEMAAGNTSKAQHLHWRARSSLKGAMLERFTARSTL